MSGSGLVHLLLLHLEGTQVHWQGKTEHVSCPPFGESVQTTDAETDTHVTVRTGFQPDQSPI